MRDNSTDNDFEKISAMIRKEELEALAFLRARNFRGRLESRLKEEAGRRKPVAPFSRIAVPVLAAVLLLVVAGAFLFIMKRPASGPPPEFKALASALGQLPGFSHTPRWEWTVPAGQTGTSRLAESVQQVLVAADQEKREDEQDKSIPAGTSKVPRLSLDQKMEILFKERAIERVLRLFKDNYKEV